MMNASYITDFLQVVSDDYSTATRVVTIDPTLDILKISIKFKRSQKMFANIKQICGMLMKILNAA